MGQASAKQTEPSQALRRARASAGARARWEKSDPSRALLPKAEFGAKDRPLQIGNILVPCFVLDDARRVLTVGGISNAIGLRRGGPTAVGMSRLQLLASQAGVKPFLALELEAQIHAPIAFLTPTGGKAYGYDAQVLVDLCKGVLEAREAGCLGPEHANIADQCQLVTRGLAPGGITRMIDDTTGYREAHRRGAFQKMLGDYVDRDLLPWTERFPEAFYVEIYRLMNWSYLNPGSAKDAEHVAELINILVYDRLPPDLRHELRRQPPAGSETKRRYSIPQLNLPDVGNPHLEQHITRVITLLRISDSWPEFIAFRRKHDARMPAEFHA